MYAIYDMYVCNNEKTSKDSVNEKQQIRQIDQKIQTQTHPRTDTIPMSNPYKDKQQNSNIKPLIGLHVTCSKHMQNRITSTANNMPYKPEYRHPKETILWASSNKTLWSKCYMSSTTPKTRYPKTALRCTTNKIK